MIANLLKSSTQMTATLRFNRVTICLRLYWSQRIYPVRFQPSLNSIEIDLVCWLLLTQFFCQSLPRVVISTDLFVVPICRMLSQKWERGILTKYMTEQPNDQKKPHGVDFSFNYQFSCSLGYDSVPSKFKLRMTLTFSYELLLKHLL